MVLPSSVGESVAANLIIHDASQRSAQPECARRPAFIPTPTNPVPGLARRMLRLGGEQGKGLGK